MRIALCDDEKYMRMMLRERLDAYAKKRALVFNYEDFADGSELLKADRIFDLIFLDYKMKELNGMDTARELRNRNVKTAIVFLTSISDIIRDTFEVNTFRFLDKPIINEKLYKALDDFLKSFTEDEYLSLLDCPKIIRIRYDDIYYAEATNKTCIIHTVNEDIDYPFVLLKIEKMLPADRFIRTHKSFIVGFKHIISRSAYTITLDNKQEIDLGRNHVASFKEKYIDYMSRYYFDTE